jgi:hypothetical protein
MHHASYSDRSQVHQKEAHELARDARALQKAARETPRLATRHAKATRAGDRFRQRPRGPQAG